MATNDNGTYLPNDAGRFSGTTIIVCCVSLVALALASVVGLVVFGGPDGKSTPLIVTILGFVGTNVTALLALLRTDQTRRELHNGLIPAKVHEAVAEGVQSGTLQVRVDRRGMRERSTDKEGNDNG